MVPQPYIQPGMLNTVPSIRVTLDNEPIVGLWSVEGTNSFGRTVTVVAPPSKEPPRNRHEKRKYWRTGKR